LRTRQRLEGGERQQYRNRCQSEKNEPLLHFEIPDYRGNYTAISTLRVTGNNRRDVAGCRTLYTRLAGTKGIAKKFKASDVEPGASNAEESEQTNYRPN
jgi:hypothetical protein